MQRFEHNVRLWQQGLQGKPITCSTPIAFYCKWTGHIFAFRHHDAIALPTPFHSKMTHHAKCHVDIWLRHDVAVKSQCHAASHRCYHQQSRHELAAHTAVNEQLPAMKPASFNPERRKAFLAQIIDTGTPLAQRIHKDSNRPLTHAHAAVEHHRAPLLTCKKSSQKPHRRPGSPNVNALATTPESLLQNLAVIALLRAW